MGIIIAPLIAFLQRARKHRAEIRAFRATSGIMSQMSDQLRRDIGWPDRFLKQRGRRK